MKFKRKVLLALLFTLWIIPAAAAAMSGSDEQVETFHPTITSVKGTVTVKGAKYPAWEEVSEGMLLLSGDTLRTGRNSYARVEFPSGSIEIYETTVLVIPTIDIKERKKDIHEVFIEDGKTLFDINPTGVERDFKFRTRNIQGGVKGTVFTVSYLDGGTTVNVYSGVVEVSGPGGSGDGKVALAAGRAVRVNRRSDLKKVMNFDPSAVMKKYHARMLPELDNRGLPTGLSAWASESGKGENASGDFRSSVKESDPNLDSFTGDAGIVGGTEITSSGSTSSVDDDDDDDKGDDD